MCVEVSGCRLAVDREYEARWRSFDEKIKKWDVGMVKLNRVCSFPFNFQFDQIFDLVQLTKKDLEFF